MNNEKKLPPGWGQQTSSQPVWSNIKSDTQSHTLDVGGTDTPRQADTIYVPLAEDKKLQEVVEDTFEVEEPKAIVKETVKVEESKKTVEELAEVEQSKELVEQIVDVEGKSQSTPENSKKDKKQTGKKGSALIIVLVVIIILLLGIIGLGICLKGGVLKEGFGEKLNDTTSMSETMTESKNKENSKADNNSQTKSDSKTENNAETESNSETEKNAETESNSEVQNNSEIVSNSKTENNSQTESNSETENKPETDNDMPVDNEVENEGNTTPSDGNNSSGSIVYETSVDWSKYAGTWSESSVVHTHGNTTCYDVSLNLKLYEDGDIYYNMKMCNGYSQHTTSKGFLYSDGDGTYSGSSLDSVYKVEIGVFQGGIHIILTNSYNIWDCADAYLTMKID